MSLLERKEPTFLRCWRRPSDGLLLLGGGDLKKLELSFERTYLQIFLNSVYAQIYLPN